MPQAPRIPKPEWEVHKALITDLYINQNKTLDEVIEYMAALGFCPSRSQWIRKLNDNWKLRKNSTKEEWQHASSLLSKRKENGKDTDLVMNGKIVSSKKRKKELRRYSTLQTEQVSLDSSQFHAVTVSTPPASGQQEVAHGRSLPSFHIPDTMTSYNKSEPFISNTTEIPETPYVSEVASKTIEMMDEMFPESNAHQNKERLRWPVWIQIFQALLLISTNNLWNDIETSFECLDQLLDIVLPKGHLGNLEILLIGKKETNGKLATHLLFSALKIDSSESLELMRFLLRSGVSPNSTHPKPSSSSRWWTALHDAVYWNSQGSVKLLIEFGANPHPISGTNMYTPLFDISLEHLHNCSILHRPRVVDGITFDDCRHCHEIPPLFQAVRNGSLHCAQTLLGAGVDPNYFHPSLFTALHCAISMADLSMVRLLIQAGALPDIRPLEGFTTLLSGAARLQKLKTVLSPLQSAVRSECSSIVEYLLYSGARPDIAEDKVKCWYGEPYTESLETCLQISASTGNYKMMCLLLTSGANPNSRHPDTPTALQTVCGSASTSPLERYHAASMLLRHGAEINASPVPRGGRTALQAAVEVDDYRLAELLLHEGADRNAPATQDGITAMAAAIKCGSKDLKRLIIKNSNLEVALESGHDKRRQKGCLEMAISAGNITLLSNIFMIENGRNLSLSDEDAERVVISAIFEGSLFLVQQLLTIYPQVNISWLLCESVWQGKSEIVEWILSLLPHYILNLPSYTQPSPLWIALHQRNSYLVRRLLLAGADPNHKSCHICRRELSSTSDYPVDMRWKRELPIEQAISPGHGHWEEDTEMIQMLVSHGAQVNCPVGDIHSAATSADTPLLFALKKGKYKIAEFLLNKGAEPNAAERMAKPTSIIYASRAANYSLVKLLIEQGANVKESYNLGSSIHALTRYGECDGPNAIQNLARTCRLLLDSRANVNANTAIGCTAPALQIAIDRGKHELIDIFLEAGANIHTPAHWYGGKTALQAAASTRNFKLVKRLVEMGADINAPPAEKWGATALQYAAYSGHVNMAIFLLEHGAAVNAPGSLSRGFTALQGACEYGRLDMIHLLLENDQDPDTVEERCRNFAGIAKEQGFTQIAEFLRGYKRP